QAGARRRAGAAARALAHPAAEAVRRRPDAEGVPPARLPDRRPRLRAGARRLAARPRRRGVPARRPACRGLDGPPPGVRPAARRARGRGRRRAARRRARRVGGTRDGSDGANPGPRVQGARRRGRRRRREPDRAGTRPAIQARRTGGRRVGDGGGGRGRRAARKGAGGLRRSAWVRLGLPERRRLQRRPRLVRPTRLPDAARAAERLLRPVGAAAARGASRRRAPDPDRRGGRAAAPPQRGARRGRGRGGRRALRRGHRLRAADRSDRRGGDATVPRRPQRGSRRLHRTCAADVAPRPPRLERDRRPRLPIPRVIHAAAAPKPSRPATGGGDDRRRPEPVQSLGERSNLVKIVIPDDYPSVYEGRADLARLRTLGEVEHHTTRPSGPDELRARLVGADACINVRSYCIFDRALLDALPTLRMISILGTGTDNVDLAYAAELGVVVTNTPGAAATSVAEFTIGLMFAVSRSIVLCDRRLR